MRGIDFNGNSVCIIEMSRLIVIAAVNWRIFPIWSV